LEEQLIASNITPESKLEKLIQENQDFHLLHPSEATDKIGLPLWLRVLWRKNHPEPGFYPRALKYLHSWMMHHPDLPEGTFVPRAEPRKTAEAAKPGQDLRISGPQTTPRSESDIRINFNNANQLIAASNDIGTGGQAQFLSSDGGVSWKQTNLSLRPGDHMHSDPAVDWTSDGTAWAITIGINATQTNLQLRAYRSSDGGATWNFDATASGTQTAADKELMWVDRSATSPFKDNIYVVWHNNNPVFVNRRTGPSGTWQTPIQISGAETTGLGIGGDIKTNSAGDVFAFWPDSVIAPTPANMNPATPGRLFVAKSTDGGVHFGKPVQIASTFDSYDIGIPADDSRRVLIYVSGGAYHTATEDFVYAIWADQATAPGTSGGHNNEPGSNVHSPLKTRIWFSRSADGGTHWQASRKINDQASLNDQFNARLTVDETNGELMVMYYDTVTDPGRLKTDVFVQSSSDRGNTWTTAAKVTSKQTDETTAGADSGNQYGDYNGLSGLGGKFFPCWTDRRSGGKEEIWINTLSVGAGTGGTGAPQFEPLPLPVEAHPVTVGAPRIGPSVEPPTISSRSVAIVGLVGITAVMGMVATAGIVAAVAINKDKS
jgi:hypothetical protein